MSRHYLTILGTGSYDECNYAVKNQDNSIEKFYKTKYIQAAVFKMFCEDFTDGDKFTVFLTGGARKRHFDPLCEELKKLKEGRNINIYDVDILEGLSPEEQWQNFNIIYECLSEGEDIIIDITHGFRVLPMQLFIILDYAKKIKHINVDAIYYGVFEQPFGFRKDNGEYLTYQALAEYKIPDPENPQRKIYDKSRADVYYPVVDYSSYMMITDLSSAAHIFSETGNAETLKNISRKSKADRFRDATIPADTKNEFKALNVLSEDLSNITESIKCSRGNSGKITEKFTDVEKSIYHAVKKYQIDIKQNTLDINSKSEAKAIKNIIDYMDDVIKDQFGDALGCSFEESNIRTGICVVGWCLKYGLIQAGFTALEETVITWLRSLVDDEFISGISNASSEREKRDAVGKLSNESGINRKANGQECDEMSDNVQKLIDRCPEYDMKSILVVLESIKQSRNDINHFGFSIDQRKVIVLRNNLESYYHKFLQLAKL